MASSSSSYAAVASSSSSSSHHDDSLSLDAPSSSSDVPTITLVSKEGDAFKVPVDDASISVLIRSSLENDKTCESIRLLVEGKTLAKVVEYMDHHKGKEAPNVEKPLRDKSMSKVCKDLWDAEFIDAVGYDRSLLYSVILAANYLDIKGLLHLGCAKVASLAKGEPVDKIKEILDPNRVDPSPSSSSSSAAASAASAASAGGVGADGVVTNLSNLS